MNAIPQSVIQDFPILSRQIHDGKRLVYLDNAATSQKPRAVVEAISNYYYEHNANVHRGVHQLGDESTKLFHASRQQIAAFFGAQPEELVVVRNTTEAVNQVAYTWGEAHIGAGDVIISTELEHHSNLVPWQELCQRKGAQLVLIDVDEQGRLQHEQLLAEVKKAGAQLKLVAFTHVSNALGTLVPVAEFTAEIKKLQPQVRVLVDGAQAAPHVPIDFAKLSVDFYVVSAHKMLGPMGIGGLLIREEVLAELPPFLFGGGMIAEVHRDKATYAEDLEERFTAGTPDVAGLVGWAAACAYLQKIGWSELVAHDQKLVAYALQKLASVPELQIVGPTKPLAVGQAGGSSQPLGEFKLDRVGAVAFLYRGVHAHDVGQILDSEGVAVRSGHHCTMPLHTKFGWPATVRVSFQLYNTTEDIDALVAALAKVKKIFGK